MQIKGDKIVCRIFNHVACFGCGKGIATSYDGEKAVRKMAREAGAKKMLIDGNEDSVKQWYCKSCAAQHSVNPTDGIQRGLRAESTTEQNPAPEQLPTPPIGG